MRALWRDERVAGAVHEQNGCLAAGPDLAQRLKAKHQVGDGRVGDPSRGLSEGGGVALPDIPVGLREGQHLRDVGQIADSMYRQTALLFSDLRADGVPAILSVAGQLEALE